MKVYDLERYSARVLKGGNIALLRRSRVLPDSVSPNLVLTIEL